jgi:branched-chain amino acid transport system substrate-binding protein
LIDDGFLLGVADHQSGAPQIKLDKQDDACTPEKAVSVVQQFISSNSVQAMLGPGCSGAMAATQKLMAKAQLVHSSGSYQPSLTQVGDQFYFRTVPNDTELNTALAKYIASKGYKSLAVVNDDTSYGTGGAQVLIDQVQKLGVKVVYHGKFTYGATDFSGQTVRLRDSHADAFFFDGYEGELGVLVKQTRQLGLTEPIFGPTAMGNPEFLEPAGSAADGVTYISNYNRGNPKTMAFTKAYKAKFGITPTDVAASSYLVGVTYAEAFKAAGPDARGEALAKAIRGLDVPTPLGTISYDANGDLKNPPIIIGTIDHGQPKVVEDLSNG